ncbi:hypothetical protein [Aureimonas sp. ME7]|uniref:hypothetical protein n=1 Tax=Aureimonas sp. ME7 TaxID=2744252 RepID=UPI0015FC3700|nr:hypothetical protein [Aureimonas sp. ME7]
MKAATAVSNRFGGFANALSAVAASDLSAIQFIVRQGVSLRDISNKELEEEVYLAGTRNIMADVMKFVTRLANGGRDPDLEGEGDDKTADEGAEGNGD